jgi:hypothetical protein
MDHDAFNIRVARSLTELHASAVRTEAMLKQVLELLQPKTPEVLPSPMPQPSPSAPLPSPWDDFVT